MALLARKPTIHLMVWALFVSAVWVIGPAFPAEATTGNDNERALSRTFCAEVAINDVSVGVVRQLLEDAAEQWEKSLDAEGDPIFNLTVRTSDCQTGDTEVTAETLPTLNGALARWEPVSNSLQFYTFGDWIASGADRSDNEEYSLLGVMTHEMGHSLGIWHAGDDIWSFDGDVPTMQEGVTPLVSDDKEDLAQDDFGSAQWVEWYGSGVGRFFSFDTSFEEASYGMTNPDLLYDTSEWGYALDDGAAIDQRQTEDGDYAVLIQDGEEGEGVFITSVFDPWKGSDANSTLMPGMDPDGNNSHRLQGYTRYRWKSGNGGKVKVAIQLRYISYDPTDAKTDGVWQSTSWTSWVSNTCQAVDANWATCKKGVSIYLSTYPTIFTAPAFRVEVTAADGPLFIDRTGARRRDV